MKTNPNQAQLKRYEIEFCSCADHEMVEKPEGAYVKLSDIEPLIKTLKRLSQDGDGTSGARHASKFDTLEELQVEHEERMSLACEALKKVGISL